MRLLILFLIFFFTHEPFGFGGSLDLIKGPNGKARPIKIRAKVRRTTSLQYDLDQNPILPKEHYASSPAKVVVKQHQGDELLITLSPF